MYETLYFVLALLGWVVFLYYLWRSGLMKRLGLTNLGPFLMLKTVRGRNFIDRISRARRFWAVFGDLSVAIVIATMVGMTVLLVWTATIVSRIPVDRAPSPQTIIGLPGINPIIPVGYGILGLAVAIVVHEFCHGILARLANVKINSLGILLLILPMGAFVEPDENELNALGKRARGRMFAAGPAVNILIAIVTLLIFTLILIPGVVPEAQGAGVRGVTDYPAKGHLEPGMIITWVNGTRVTTVQEFQAAMALTQANRSVIITAHQKGVGDLTFNLVLADKYNITHKDADRGKGFLGVEPVTTDPGLFDPLAAATIPDFFRSMLNFIALPFAFLMPVQDPLTSFYSLGGPYGAVPEPIFWAIANSIYWLFWINLMLGMTNALPAVPLDGGYLFRDLLDGLLVRFRADMATERRQKLARGVSNIIAIFILSLVVWQIIGPRYFGALP